MRPQPVKVFISYAHEDKKHLLDLKQHLAGPSRDGTLRLWVDEQIHPGHTWRREILRNLDTADIVLPLVSPAYLDSDFCILEAKIAMERHHMGRVRVVPILIRYVDWISAPFADLQFLPGGEPVPEIGADRDAAFSQISLKLREIASELRRQGRLAENEVDLAEAERLNTLAVALADLGESKVALEELDRAVAICRQAGENPDSLASLLSNRGLVLQDLGDLAGARGDLELALEISEGRYDRRHPLVVVRLIHLSGVLLELGEAEKARPLLEEAIDSLETSGSIGDHLLRARIHLAGALGAVNEPRKAEALLKEVLATEDIGPKAAAAAYSTFGRLAYQDKRLRKARFYFERALEVGKEEYGGHHPYAAINLHNLGLTLRALSNPHEAEQRLRDALAVLAAKLGAGSPRAVWARTALEGMAVQTV